MAAGDIIIVDGKITPEILGKITSEVVKNIQTTAKDPGQYPAADSLQNLTTLPAFRVSGATYELVRVAVSLLRGVDGKEVHLQVSDGYIQWRWTDGEWQDMIPLSDLKGDKGDPVVFRTSSVGVEWKYQPEPDTAYRLLVSYEMLKLKFTDLTADQIAAFWKAVPADVVELFQRPAKEAAAEAREVISDMLLLESTVEANEKNRDASETRRVASEQERIVDEIARKSEFDRIKQDAEEAITRANTATEGADDKAEEASLAAEKAATQGEFAQNMGNKLSQYEKRFTDLETGKVDGGYSEEGFLQLTSLGLPVGDPIPVGSGSGGGGGGGVTCKVKAITDTLISTVTGADVRIGYNFTSVYTDDESETGEGTATYAINSQKVATESIRQGNTYFDVTKWLITGSNSIRVTVKDSTGQSRSVAYTVEVISMSISDNYNAAQINTGSVTYRYTPVGAIEKTIHFSLDGTDLESVVTTESNKQLSYVISAQAHGAHRLVVYMTAIVSGVEVRSNTLTRDLICAVAGNNTLIVASEFNQSGAKQYDRLAIPFVVYDPAAITAPVTLSVNGKAFSEQTVDRTLQTWNYRVSDPGALTLKITSGNVSRSFNLEVSAADVVVEAETADLELYLTAQNRSNNDNNRDQWIYGTIRSSLTGFNWKTNGWIADESGSVCLRVNGGAGVAIPLRLFEKDFRSEGKTVEIEFLIRDVYRYDTPVIACWSGERGILVTSQSAQIKSEQSDLTTRFKDMERVRLAFVVEKRTDNRLLSIYVNGIKSATFQYPDTDDFMQSAPVDLTIGGADATVDVYTIRSYANNLNRYQLLDNYIADMDDYDRKVETFAKNDIYDEYGNVSFAKINKRIDCLVLEGDLPQYKGDKKTNKFYFYSSSNSALNWYATVKNNVQGTSSQYYPRKNHKFELLDGLTYSETGAHADAYQVTDDVLPATIFCLKTDFAESSGTHNTGVANMADWMLKEMGFLTDAQKENPRYRTTVAGRPCVLFHKAAADSQPAFLGKVNFNTDKGAENTFGFTTDNDESWEFLNNTSDLTLFKSADFSKWQEAIEARYPDGGADITNVKKVFDWVVGCKGDADRFNTGYNQYFDKDMLVFYALITLTLGMTDQRAKNMFLTRYRGKLWLFILYDNDTLLPINNEGLIALLYNVEIRDTVNGASVWNGADSELWKLVEDVLADEIREMYFLLRQRNILSYDRMMDYLYNRQAGKWCEAIYNEDGYYKYEEPLIAGFLDYSQSHENPQLVKTGAYLYALQGSREMYGKWIWKNRFLYMDSKYLAGSILGDTAVFRTYTPAEWTGVAPNADITLTAFNAMYFNVRWGSVTKSRRVGFNETYKMVAPDGMQFNDTETIVYGASLIASLGDLSPLYPGTVDVSKMAKLKELIIGSGAEGYQNRNLRTLSIGENRMLRKLDVRNCPLFSEPIAAQGCDNIEEIYAQGTAVTAVNLPEGGNLSRLYLPETVTNLVLRNQPRLLDAFFSIAGVGKLSTIISENTPGVNIFLVMDRCFGLLNPVLTRVRLIGIDSTGANLDTLYKLTKIGGIDEKGNNVPVAIVTGKFHAVTAVENKLDAIHKAFPELTVTYTNLRPPTVTTFVFRSSQSKSLTNGVFECDQEFVKVNEYTYKVTADDDSYVNLTFKADNHEARTDRYLVSGTRTQEYLVNYIPLRTIRVKVYGQSVYLANAQITIGEDVYLSDTNGYVYIRGGMAVKGTVSAAGYGGNTFDYSAITDDTSHTLEVYAVVDVKFVVKDNEGSLVEGAIIICEGLSKTTNIYGEVIFQLVKGEHDYEITHPSYFEFKGILSAGTTSSIVNVSVILDYDIIKPEGNGNIQMRVTGLYCIVSISSSTTDYIIDWGDGFNTSASNTGSVDYTHTYSILVTHEIEIRSCAEITYARTKNSNITAYWSIGESKVHDLFFSECSQLKYIGEVFKNDVGRTHVYQLFYNCSGLTDIDLAPLSEWNPTSVSFLLNGCSSLTSINLTPLAGWVNVTNASYMIGGCSNLTSIDLTPLAGWKKVTDVSYMFASLVGLTSINLTPLEGWKMVTDASRFLTFCKNITILDLTPLAGWTGVRNAFQMIYNCKSLTSIDLTPLARWIRMTNNADLISSCSSLSFISILATPPFTLSNKALENGNSCPIYVPDGEEETFKTATNWSAYANRIKPISEKPAE